MLSQGSSRKKKYQYLFFYLFVFIGVVSWASPLLAVDKYWIGPSGGAFENNAHWSTTSGGANNTTFPGLGDNAIFDGGGNTDCVINSSQITSTSINGLYLKTGFTATVWMTGGTTLNITGAVAGLNIASGTFDTTNEVSNNTFLNINNTAPFNLTGGMFKSPANVTLTGKFFQSGTGNFNANNGHVTFFSNSATNIDSAADVLLTFYRLTFAKGTINVLDNIAVENELWLQDGSVNSSSSTVGIHAHWDVIVFPTFDSSSVALFLEPTDFAGLDLNLTGAEAKFDGDIMIDAGTNTVFLKSDLTMDNGSKARSIYVKSGVFDAGGHKISMTKADTNAKFSQTGGRVTNVGQCDFRGGFEVTGGIFDAPAPPTILYLGNNTTIIGTSFNHNYGTVIFHGAYKAGPTISANGTTFYNLQFGYLMGNTWTIAADNIINITNELRYKTGSVSGGTMKLSGDFAMELAGTLGVTSIISFKTPLEFTGTDNQIWDITAGTGLTAAPFDGNITINKPAGIVTLVGTEGGTDLILNYPAQYLKVAAGTLDLNGINIRATQTNSTIVVQSGSVLQLQGGETIEANEVYPQFDPGSTVVYNGSGTYPIRNWLYGGNLTFNSFTGRFQQVAPLDVNGDLTIAAAMVESKGFDTNLGGNWYNFFGNYDSGGNTVSLVGGDQAIGGKNSFNNLSKTAGSLTFPSGEITRITRTFDMQGVPGNLLKIRSDVGGTQAMVDFQGDRNVGYLDVQGNNNIDPDIVVCPTCLDSSNNTGWCFEADGCPVDTCVVTTEVCDGVDNNCDGQIDNAVNVDDGNACTTDSCDSATGQAVNTTIEGCCLTDTECRDGDRCNGVEACVNNTCQAGTAVVTDDGNACTTDSCNPITGDVTNIESVNVDDGNACTTDSCDSATGQAVNTPIEGCCLTDTECRDGDRCNGVETCVNNTCQAGTPLDCNDSNVCTIDSCVANTGCKNETIASSTDNTCGTCGDNILNMGEECDDGNTTPNDGCENCQVTTIDNCPDDPNKTEPGSCGCGTADTDTDGDNVADCIDNCPNAANDGQEDSDGDGMGDACDAPSCGNGTKETGEVCDDGNNSANDDCGPTCLVEVCGDGIVQTSIARVEECDDGNNNNEDGCDQNCLEENKCDPGVSHESGIVKVEANKQVVIEITDTKMPVTIELGKISDQTTTYTLLFEGAFGGEVSFEDSSNSGSSYTIKATAQDYSFESALNPEQVLTLTNQDKWPDTMEPLSLEGNQVVMLFELESTNPEYDTVVLFTVNSKDQTDECFPMQPEPEVTAIEICDGVDNDNDGQVDEDFLVGESCSPVGVSNPCQTGTYVCNAQGSVDCQVINLADDTSCDDGLFCNGQEACQAGSCVAGTAPTIPASEDCVDYTCDEDKDQVVANNKDSSCDDGDLCNGVSVCQSGVCVDETAVAVPSETTCQSFECNPLTGAIETVNKTDGTSCGDSNACNGEETCQSGECVAGTTASVPDDTACITYSCDDNTGEIVATNVANGTSCDDGNSCTSDQCVDGACVGSDIESSACDTGLSGICAEGKTLCAVAGTTCEQTSQAEDEICDDSLDNDCDGKIDREDSDCEHLCLDGSKPKPALCMYNKADFTNPDFNSGECMGHDDKDVLATFEKFDEIQGAMIGRNPNELMHHDRSNMYVTDSLTGYTEILAHPMKNIKTWVVASEKDIFVVANEQLHHMDENNNVKVVLEKLDAIRVFAELETGDLIAVSATGILTRLPNKGTVEKLKYDGIRTTDLKTHIANLKIQDAAFYKNVLLLANKDGRIYGYNIDRHEVFVAAQLASVNKLALSTQERALYIYSKRDAQVYKLSLNKIEEYLNGQRLPNNVFATPKPYHFIDKELSGLVYKEFCKIPQAITPPCDATDEVCDGVDNDCDNEIDEGFDVDQTCGTTVNDCIVEGVYVCNSDGSGVDCDISGVDTTDFDCSGATDGSGNADGEEDDAADEEDSETEQDNEGDTGDLGIDQGAAADEEVKDTDLDRIADGGLRAVGGGCLSLSNGSTHPDYLTFLFLLAFLGLNTILHSLHTIGNNRLCAKINSWQKSIHSKKQSKIS